ncbi:Fc receptor-like protein 5 [Alosa pseudoharengus]|uniref:Fc receptor-like protein 5 n=1 Tax=Alosa pseudoharengus TaxID=34774 RepID=UPI003F8CC415
MVVLDIPTPTIRMQSPQQLHSADRVTLSCDITQGGGWIYLWDKNNEHIHHLINRTITISLPEESGRYECSGVRRGLRTHNSPSMTVSMKATIAVEPQSPVFTGETLTLTCVIEYRSDWTYKWYKGSSALVSEGNSFTIRRAAESDEGQYWCQGERRDNDTILEKSKKVNIQVNALPTATLTVDPQSPVFTGESLTLKCEIEPESVWKYKWYKGSSPTPEFESEGNIYTITAAARSDGVQYWCQGERTDRPTTSERSNEVNIQVMVLSAMLTIEPQSPVFTGEKVTLKCKIESLSGWTYKWYKGSSRTPVSEGNTFTIRGAAESDKGQYWCQGERRHRPTSSEKSNQTEIKVNALPKPKLVIAPQSPVFMEENVTLKCEIKSQRGWKYKWYKDIYSEPFATSDTNTTTIKGATESDKGKYWCQGERRHRPRATQPSTKAHLSVQTLPEAKLTAEPQSPVSTGGMVTLKCVIESHSNWTYMWYKDKKNNLVIEGNNFTITRATDSDEGTYWCQGVRRERPTSSQFSNSVYVGKKGSGSSLLIMGVAVAGGVASGVVLTIIILKVLPRCCRRQNGPVTNSSSAGLSLSPSIGLAERHTDEQQDQSDGGGLPVYETIPLTYPSRPVMDTVYDKLSLSKMGNLSSPCNPYQLVE